MYVTYTVADLILGYEWFCLLGVNSWLMERNYTEIKQKRYKEVPFKKCCQTGCQFGVVALTLSLPTNYAIG